MGLKVVLDLPSLKSSSSKKILEYGDNDYVEFLSFVQSDKYTLIKFQEDKDDTYKSCHQLSIKKVDKITKKVVEWSHYSFGYRLQDIKKFSEVLDIKYDDLFLAYILDILTRSNLTNSKTKEKNKYILVTERKKILSKTNQLRNPFPKLVEFTIFSPEEAKLYIDLYMKERRHYKISPIKNVNKGLWYLLSMKSKVINYQFPWSIVVHLHSKDKNIENYFYSMASLGDRLTEMLMAIDEIGMSFYEGSSNDTLDTSIYHFNYWVSLYAGVIDNLAWISKYRYNLAIQNEQDLRLYSEKKDNQFINQLYLKNINIKNHIKRNIKIVNLIDGSKGARDSILHRERLRGVRYINKDKHININVIRPSEDFQKRIQTFSKYGKNQLLGEHTYLEKTDLFEPYSFVKNATPLLFCFVDEFLHLLNFKEYLDTNTWLKKIIDEVLDEQYLDMLKSFEYHALGY